MPGPEDQAAADAVNGHSGRSRRTALVTGAAGFIGSTLADRMLADGWTVVGVDSFEPFYARELKERNLRSARGNERFRFHEVDTRDLEALREVVRGAHPEVIVDFAARAGVRPSLADPWLYIDINVRGLQNLLRGAAEVGARFVFASSSSVYGDDPRRPFREDQMRSRPISPYGATKVAGEALVYAHHASTGLPVAIARLFTVYGPRQRPDLAIYRFATRMLQGQPVELYDEGRASRDYTFVDDAVDAFARLVECQQDYVVVNVGSHRPVVTADLLDLMEANLGLHADRMLLPAQPGDVPATFADVTRAAELLGWRPTTPLGDGIAHFLEWLRQQPRQGWGPGGPD